MLMIIFMINLVNLDYCGCSQTHTRNGKVSLKSEENCLKGIEVIKCLIHISIIFMSCQIDRIISYSWYWKIYLV